MSQSYYIYILASQKRGTIYIGVTSNLAKRICEHREGLVSGFTKKYHVTRLVHIEEFSDVDEAILHEKRLKKWNRAWKIELIEKDNPDWRNLWFDLNR